MLGAGIAVVAVAGLASGALALRGGLLGGAGADALPLAGDLRAHDPALVVGEEGEPWFVYSTGDVSVGFGAPQIRRSDDGGRTWALVGTAWDSDDDPAWVRDEIDGVTNFWAPELYQHDGTWYLYYSASTFGKNRSLIALATNTTLDPDDPDYEWVDRGEVVGSVPGDAFNAIDPGVAVDEAGTPWMAFGSFWSGIRMVELEWPDGLRADPAAEPLRLADRGAPPNAIEAPYLMEHDGDWFLFVSRDSCCQGSDSTYKIAVGRADAPTGPFVDRDGVPLLEDGGTILAETEGTRIGPGGQSVADGMMALHYYDGELNGQFRLALVPIEWGDDGWPELDW